MIDPAPGMLLSGLFALLFLSAALHKARNLAVFAAVLRAYRVLPERLTLAWPVPLLEFAIAVALLVMAWRAVAALSGALLLTLYGLAMAVNLRRGRRDLSCGCGAAHERRAIAAWMVWRNLLFALALSALALPWSTRALQAVDLLTVVGGIAVAALLYMGADRLLGRIAPRVALWGGSP